MAVYLYVTHQGSYLFFRVGGYHPGHQVLFVAVIHFLLLPHYTRVRCMAFNIDHFYWYPNLFFPLHIFVADQEHFGC